MITIEYPLHGVTLANACLFYMRSKTFLRVMRLVIRVLASLVLLLLVMKMFMHGLSLSEGGIFIVCSLWLFTGARYTRWRLLKKMQKQQLEGKSIRIDITENGVTWKGAGLIASSMPWVRCTHVFELANGFIFPTGYSRFLWLPFTGFKNDEAIQAFKALLLQREIPLRKKSLIRL